MLALLRVAGRFGAAEELANEPVRRAGHAEREPLGSRDLQVGHLARAGRDAADALQAQVRAVMGAHEVAPGREDPTTDRGVTEGGDHRTGGAREDRRRRSGERRGGGGGGERGWVGVLKRKAEAQAGYGGAR